MAEAFFNRLSGKNEAISAGTNVGVNEGLGLHELVVKCMAELGYDLSKNKRKQLTKEMVEDADRVIIMARQDSWPNYLENNKKVVYWDVEDGAGQSYDFHCKIRDKIKNLVEKLVQEIK